MSLATSFQTERVNTLERRTFSLEVTDHFNQLGKDYDKIYKKMRFYIRSHSSFLKDLIPEKRNVLLIGVLASEVIENLNPKVAVAIDPSLTLINKAKEHSKNKAVEYVCCLPENFETQEKFDFIIVSNLLDYSDDVLALIGCLTKFCHAETRIIFSTINPLWDALARMASVLGIRIPDTKRNLIASKLVCSGLEIKGFKVVGTFNRIFIPRYIPLLSHLFNQYLSRLPILRKLCFLQYVVATPFEKKNERHLTCSVVIPCYNEEKNVFACISRVPSMGEYTEIIAVNDGSKDGTLSEMKRAKLYYPNLKVVTYDKNRGKGEAVVEGMKASSCDVCMILDADMTVPPEELNEFFDAIANQACDFVSGTRFLYPMEKQAMRLFNYFGNIIFSKLIEIILGQSCTDTLCGTKAFKRKDFEDFVLEDKRWGDFDLIFHAAKKKLRFMEIPVHYKNRLFGESKMKAFSSGISFLKLCLRKWATLN